MTSRKSIFVLIVLVAGVATVGCSKKEEATETPKQEAAVTPAQPPTTGQMVLLKFGPQPVKAGKNFNVQPNGQSAMWAQGDSITPSTVIVLNNLPLKSLPNKDGKSVTAFVPQELYTTPGEFQLFLLDTKTNSKSNDLKFIVK